MNSITKPLVTQDQIDRICEKHLGFRPDKVVEQTDGWFNSVFMIEHEMGNYVLKAAPADSIVVLRYEHAMMESEVGAMRLASEKSGLPVPKIIAFDQSDEILASKYLLTECVQGIRLDHAKTRLSEDLNKQAEHNLGNCVRNLHDIAGEAFGMFANPSCSTWNDGFCSLLEDLKRDQQDRAIELPKATFEVIKPHLSALNEVKIPSLIHWDLWDNNVFVSPEDGRVTGIIDFERAMWADPLMEARFMVPTDSFIAGYGRNPFEEAGAKARRALYTFHLSLVMVIECTYRGFDKEHEESSREFLGKTIGELMALS